MVVYSKCQLDLDSDSIRKVNRRGKRYRSESSAYPHEHIYGDNTKPTPQFRVRISRQDFKMDFQHFNLYCFDEFGLILSSWPFPFICHNHNISIVMQMPMRMRYTIQNVILLCYKWNCYMTNKNKWYTNTALLDCIYKWLI